MPIAPLASHSRVLPENNTARQPAKFAGHQRQAQDVVTIRHAAPHTDRPTTPVAAFEDAYTRHLYEQSRDTLKAEMLKAVSHLKLEKNQPRPTEKEVDILLNSEAYQKHFQQQVLSQLKKSGEYERILKKTTPEDLAAMTEQFNEGGVTPDGGKNGKPAVKFGMHRGSSSRNDDDEIKLSDVMQPTRAAGKMVRRSVNQAVPGMLNEANSQHLSTFLQNAATRAMNERRDDLVNYASGVIKGVASDPETHAALAHAGEKAVKGALSNLVQSALPPLCNISAGAALMAIEAGVNPRDNLVGAVVGMVVGRLVGTPLVVAGTHQLLGITQSPNAQRLLGGIGIFTSLLSSGGSLSSLFDPGVGLIGWDSFFMSFWEGLSENLDLRHIFGGRDDQRRRQ